MIPVIIIIIRVHKVKADNKNSTAQHSNKKRNTTQKTQGIYRGSPINQGTPLFYHTEVGIH